MGKPRSSMPSGVETGLADRRAELLVLLRRSERSKRIINALQGDYLVKRVSSTSALRATLFVQGSDLLLVDSLAQGQEDMAQFCRNIRLTSSVAIIALIDTEDPEAHIEVLEAGADECFPKTLSIREIKVRISGLMRRMRLSHAAGSLSGVLRFSGWSIDPHRRLVTDPSGQTVDLTTAEFDLLWAFCRNSGKPLSRHQLLGFTRAGAAGPLERSIDVHVSRLRRKIEFNPRRPIMLRTVRLGGYIFTPRVEGLTDQSDRSDG
ncbi:winged helix-turn-helix domain-containing protein [Agrobacterium albertimagni]|nr:response regulator transcription factor [Agrobacterium albertimagni]